MKKLLIIIVALLSLTTLTGCGEFIRDADIASHNVSKEADQFRTKRRIVFINLRTGEYLFQMTGNFAIETVGEELQVTCKVGEDKYQKHFLRLSNETTYTVEQLEWSEVSKYDYEIVFKPKSILPINIEVE